MDVFEFIRDEIKKRLSEKGFRVENFLDEGVSENLKQGELSQRRKPDIVVKSGGVVVGYVFIAHPQEDIVELLRYLRDFWVMGSTQNAGVTIYIAIDRSKEKNFMSSVMSMGLVGKVKFISWEFKLYNI